MNTGGILLLIMVIIGLAVILLITKLRSGYIDELNKKLSTLLNNPVIKANYQFTSLISGTYLGHSVTFEWSPPGGPNSGVLLLNMKIYDLDIPALEQHSHSDLASEQTDTANLWHELSNLSCLQEISYADHILKIEMQWGSWSKMNAGDFFKSPVIDEQGLITVDRIGQEVGSTLDNIFKILQFSG